MSSRPAGVTRAVVLAAALAGAGVACGGATVSKRLNVETTSNGPQFSQAAITVTKGDTLALEVENSTDDANRDFSIEGYNVYVQHLAPNKPVEVKIKATRSGTFAITSQSAQGDAHARLIVPR